MSAKFSVGDVVYKTKGAKFWGTIVGEPYKTLGPTGEVWHYNVCATHPEFLGTVHILTEGQIEKMPKEHFGGISREELLKMAREMMEQLEKSGDPFRGDDWAIYQLAKYGKHSHP